ncbi:hypothetical protein EDD11_002090 [Mortierella claussenii]|nr:hypothetical protein EDD11_002090 [Mortierella claussenii]
MGTGVYFDRWYVLKGLEQKNAEYEIRVAFPLKMSVDISLDVSAWTLQSAQEKMPKDIRLVNYYPEGQH